jgi:hypothetical protein
MEIKLYSCLISNIPLIEKILIQRYFKVEAQQFGDLHSVKVENNNFNNQCCINFHNKESMKNSIEYFNGRYYSGNILNAEEKLDIPSPRYQWFYKNNENKEVHLNLHHSEMVETAYKNEYDFIEVTLKHNKNKEIECISYIFSKNKTLHKIQNNIPRDTIIENLEYFKYIFLTDNSENECIQMNLRTGASKTIYRKHY